MIGHPFLITYLISSIILNMESVESWIAEDKNYDEDILELDETKITKITPKLKE